MNSEFEIGFEWTGDADSVDAYEATAAELTVSIGEHIATRVEDSEAQSVRTNVRVATFTLAEWLAANWWRLRWEPERNREPDWHWDPRHGRTPWAMSHEVATAGDGYLWPNLTIASDGEAIRIVSRPTKSGKFKLVRYLEDFTAFVSAGDFERELDRFIGATVARAANTSDGEELKLLWDEVCAERRDPEHAAWRKLEAMLGYDPDDAPDGLLETLREMEESLGHSAVEEMAAVSGDEAPKHLAALAEAAQSSPVKLHMSAVEDVAKQVRVSPGSNRHSPDMRPWQRARVAANNARQVWGLEPGPVSTQTLCDLLKIAQKDWQHDGKNSQLKFSAGHQGTEDVSLSVFLHSHYESNRRFALVRLVGDRLNDGSIHEPLVPITSVKTARQQFQRAFAQEFLCPFDDLRNSFDDHEIINEDDIQNVAERYEVSTQVITNALVNNGLMNRDALGVD